jgi:hypothetical protein
VMGVEGEAKVECGEEVELQLVELLQRQAADLRPERGWRSGGGISRWGGGSGGMYAKRKPIEEEGGSPALVAATHILQVLGRRHDGDD